MAYTAPRLNVRPAAPIVPARDPEFIRYSDTPSRPSRHQIFQLLRPRSIRAVMRDENWVPLKTKVANQVAMPHGVQHPFRERANIDSPRPDAYGSTFGLRGIVSGYPTQLVPAPAL